MSSKDLIALIIHGMGTHKKGYAKDFINGIRKQLDVPERDRIEFAPIRYSDELAMGQSELWESTKKQLGRERSLFKFDWVREFMLTSFSDAASYEHRRFGSNDSPYLAVHQVIRERIAQAVSDIDGGDGEYRVILLAHSLGTQVMSNYIYDVQNHKGLWIDGNGPDEHEDLSKLARIVSYGCNIPMFLSARSKSEIKPIDPPRDRFEWNNYYDRQDVLGWPLQPINDAYDDLVNDFQVSVGGNLTGWNPGSHMQYMVDKGFHKKVASEIRDVLYQA